MPNATAQKVLRLGVIHDGKIIQEKLVRHGQPVVVGESPKSTIVLPATARVGAGFRLFDNEGHGYHLAFTEGMQGRVSVDEVPIDFHTLRAQGLAKKRGDAFVLPLADRAKGKVVLGDVVILFQFVQPPVAKTRARLPAYMRSSLVYGMDWYFNLYLTVTSLVFLAAILFLEQVPIPEEVDFSQLDDRFVRMILPKMDKLPEPEGPKTPDKPKEEEKKPEKKKPEDDEPPSAARKKEIQKQVQNKGVLAILGVRGKQNGAIADVFGQGKTVSSDLDAVFSGMGGVEVANGSNRTSRGGGGGSGNSSSIEALKTSGGGGKGGLAEKTETHVTGNVKSEAPEVDGSLDQGTIARVVKTRLSAIKECYERELKRNPQLQGKVVVRFTIDEEGRVSAASIEDNSTGSKPVGSCIVERFERFRFPKPDGGAVTVSYPFIFTPSS